jgi:hypothetical protein
MTRLNRTRKALEAYDRTEPERAALWEAAETNSDIYAAQAKDTEALNEVREAFAEDTKDVNSRDRAFLVGISDLRWFVERDAERAKA